MQQHLIPAEVYEKYFTLAVQTAISIISKGPLHFSCVLTSRTQKHVANKSLPRASVRTNRVAVS